MPQNTVKVDRTTKWGNPFIVGKPAGTYAANVQDRRHACLLYRRLVATDQKFLAVARAELRGKNLACWCPKSNAGEDCCHAAVLLELVNG